jgi:hypothetical protein
MDSTLCRPNSAAKCKIPPPHADTVRQDHVARDFERPPIGFVVSLFAYKCDSLGLREPCGFPATSEPFEHFWHSRETRPALCRTAERLSVSQNTYLRQHPGLR